ncbi:MAG: hypothetical protein ACKOW0_00780 [Schleiferiaceae bacterium]
MNSTAKLNSLRATKAASDDRKVREQLLREAADAKATAAAGRAYDKAMGFKNGGAVKMTPKATAYKCGGMVKGK